MPGRVPPCVVIPVRPGDRNPELVFALRSIDAHVPDADVWLVGFRPSWVSGVGFIPSQPQGSKSDRGCDQVRAAVRHPGVAERFWWWDDDMFRMKPFRTVTAWHGGPISDWVERFRGAQTQYSRAVRRTADLLGSGMFYDLHVPMCVEKEPLAGVMDTLPRGVGGWLWRTVYGNRMSLGGSKHGDVKVYGGDEIPSRPGVWLSTDDASLERARSVLDQWFPRPSRWEDPDVLAAAGRTGRVTASLFRWVDAAGRTRIVRRGGVVSDPAAVSRGVALGVVEAIPEAAHV